MLIPLYYSDYQTPISSAGPSPFQSCLDRDIAYPLLLLQLHIYLVQIMHKYTGNINLCFLCGHQHREGQMIWNDGIAYRR
jgi:hypothetical protein